MSLDLALTMKAQDVCVSWITYLALIKMIWEIILYLPNSKNDSAKLWGIQLNSINIILSKLSILRNYRYKFDVYKLIRLPI